MLKGLRADGRCTGGPADVVFELCSERKHDSGVVDTAIWDLLGGPHRVLNQPILIEPDGSRLVLPLLIRSTPLPSYGNEPRITLWSGPGWPGAADAGR